MAEHDAMRVFTTGGVRDIEVTDPDERSSEGIHWNLVQKYLGTGDWSDLEQYSGVTVRGFELETDPDVIDDVEAAGDLDIEHIYVQRR